MLAFLSPPVISGWHDAGPVRLLCHNRLYGARKPAPSHTLDHYSNKIAVCQGFLQKNTIKEAITKIKLFKLFEMLWNRLRFWLAETLCVLFYQLSCYHDLVGTAQTFQAEIGSYTEDLPL